jgi:hypothetical protein
MKINDYDDIEQLHDSLLDKAKKFNKRRKLEEILETKRMRLELEDYEYQLMNDYSCSAEDQINHK